MSKIYSINTIIDLEFDVKNIHEFLTRGKNLGFQYHLSNFHINDPIELKAITIDETCTLLMQQTKNLITSIQVNSEDTFFTLYIQSNYQGTEVSFSGFHYYPWIRKFDHRDTEDIDIFRYLQLLLKLIEPYRIISLNVEKE